MAAAAELEEAKKISGVYPEKGVTAVPESIADAVAALDVACRTGDADTAAVILAEWSELPVRIIDEILHGSVQHPGIVALLLSHFGTATDPFSIGRSLTKACSHGYEDTVTEFLENRFIALLQNPPALLEGFTAACSSGQAGCARGILQHVSLALEEDEYEDDDMGDNRDRGMFGGAPLLALASRIKECMEPQLQLAAESGDAGIVGALVHLESECEHLEMSPAVLSEAMDTAAANGHVGVVSALLDARLPEGMEQHFVLPAGEPAVRAVKYGHTGVFMLLLERSMDIAGPEGQEGAGGMPPARLQAAISMIQHAIGVAVSHGQPETLEAVLDRPEYEASNDSLAFYIENTGTQGAAGALPVLLRRWTPASRAEGARCVGAAFLAACGNGHAGVVACLLECAGDKSLDWAAHGAHGLADACDLQHAGVCRAVVRRATDSDLEEADEAREAYMDLLVKQLQMGDPVSVELLLTSGRESLPSRGEYEDCRREAAEAAGRDLGDVDWDVGLPSYEHWRYHPLNAPRLAALIAFRTAHQHAQLDDDAWCNPDDHHPVRFWTLHDSTSTK